jgi:hypothetical protein
VAQAEKLVDSMLGDKQVHKPHTLPVVKDVRIFINTFNNAVDVMRSAGIDAVADSREYDDYLEYTVRIPKERSTTRSARNDVKAQSKGIYDAQRRPGIRRLSRLPLPKERSTREKQQEARRSDRRRYRGQGNYAMLNIRRRKEPGIRRLSRVYRPHTERTFYAFRLKSGAGKLPPEIVSRETSARFVSDISIFAAVTGRKPFRGFNCMPPCDIICILCGGSAVL